METVSEVVACYRFVDASLKSVNGGTQWVVGEWQKQEGELSLCGNGLHACQEPYDSLSNIYGSKWFRAEARGEMLHSDDKFCASEMRLVEEIPVRVIHQWAVDCAYRVLHLYEEKYPDDKRPREALEAAQAWIDDPTEENREKLAAARAAARDAARDAGRVAAWDAEEKWQRQHLNELIEES